MMKIKCPMGFAALAAIAVIAALSLPLNGQSVASEYGRTEPSTEAAIGEPSSPYIKLLMDSKSKAIIVLIRPWYWSESVTVLKDKQVYNVPEFGRCVKKETCYGVPDPQMKSWVPGWRRRFVYVVPTEVDSVFIGGKHQNVVPGVQVFQDGSLTTVTSCGTDSLASNSVSVVFSSSTKTNGTLYLKSVTTLPTTSGYSAVRMTSLKTESNKYLHGAELFIPPGAKLLRLYVTANLKNLFDTSKQLKPFATGVTIHYPGDFVQYKSGESERAKKLDFSADDEDEFFLAWLIYRRKNNSPWPAKVVYQDGFEVKEEFFKALQFTNENSTKDWQAELMFQDPPGHPFQVTIVDSESQYKIAMPAKSAVYALDAETHELTTLKKKRKKVQ